MLMQARQPLFSPACPCNLAGPQTLHTRLGTWSEVNLDFHFDFSSFWKYDTPVEF